MKKIIIFICLMMISTTGFSLSVQDQNNCYFIDIYTTVATSNTYIDGVITNALEDGLISPDTASSLWEANIANKENASTCEEIFYATQQLFSIFEEKIGEENFANPLMIQQ